MRGQTSTTARVRKTLMFTVAKIADYAKVEHTDHRYFLHFLFVVVEYASTEFLAVVARVCCHLRCSVRRHLHTAAIRIVARR